MAELTESFWLYGKDGSCTGPTYMRTASIGPRWTDLVRYRGQKTTLLQDGTHVDENMFTNALTAREIAQKAGINGR